MSQTYKDNPAVHLLEFFVRAQKIRDVSVTNALAQIFGLAGADAIEIHAGLARMGGMIEEIKLRLELSGQEGVAKEFDDRLMSLKGFFHIQNFSVNWNQHMANKFHGEDVTALKFSAAVLGSSEIGVDRADLDRIKEIIVDAYNAVHESDLHLGLKMVLLKNLEDMRRAVDNFEMWGPAGLREALGSLAVTANVYQAEIATCTGAQKKDIIAKVVAVANISGSLMKVCEAGGNLLAWSHAHAPLLKQIAETALTVAPVATKLIS
jgi:hypothetical protein